MVRAPSAIGEVALRRRGEVLELVVNGAFAMDTADVSTEVRLATETLARHRSPLRVLVGGLGLGFTTRAVLADARVARVDVVEIAEPLVAWARDSVVPELAALESERCRLHVADVAEVLLGTCGPAGPWDVILLDVDNGPDFLVHEPNSRLYAAALLSASLDRLAGGGVLAIWSSHRAPALLETLRSLDPAAEELGIDIARDGRLLDYAVYLASARS